MELYRQDIATTYRLGLHPDVLPSLVRFLHAYTSKRHVALTGRFLHLTTLAAAITLYNVLQRSAPGITTCISYCETGTNDYEKEPQEGSIVNATLHF